MTTKRELRQEIARLQLSLSAAGRQIEEMRETSMWRERAIGELTEVYVHVQGKRFEAEREAQRLRMEILREREEK